MKLDISDGELNKLVHGAVFGAGPEEPAPDYAGDVGRAWAVVDKMRADGWDVGLDTCRTVWFGSFTCSRGPCALHGNTRNDWHGVTHVRAESPARAICLAAVVALDRGRDGQYDPFTEEE